jgi:hypothetical protein
MKPLILLTCLSITQAQTIPAVSEAMDKAIAAKEIAGSVTLVAGPDETLHLAANGFADL